MTSRSLKVSSIGPTTAAISITQTCSTQIGLRYSRRSQPLRAGAPTGRVFRSGDGSYEYYLSEKVVINDPKGIGAFLLAATEMETRRSIRGTRSEALQ